MTRHPWRWLLGLTVALPVVVLLYDRSQMCHWVGGTDLEIEFVVTDAETGKPVGGVKVEIYQEMPCTGESKEEWKERFNLLADEQGVARRNCRCRTGGTESQLRFTNTWGVALPSWYFWVEVPGYEAVEEEFLSQVKYSRKVQRISSHDAKLIIPIELRKTKQ